MRDSHRGRSVSWLVAALGFGLCFAGLPGCARPSMRPSARRIRVFVTDADLARLPTYAAAVKSQERTGPTLWLIAGEPHLDRLLTALSDGAAAMELLNRAGVDAVVLTPSWLAWGLPRLSQMVAQARFYLLSASLEDAAGGTLGHPFLVKKQGLAILALTGVALDSTNVLLRLWGVRYTSPEYSARKTLALMRQRADLVGVMAEPRASGGPWGADFAVNLDLPGHPAPSPSPERLNWYDVSVDAGRITRGSLELTRISPDPAVAQALDSVQRAVEESANQELPRAPWTPIRLREVLVKGLLSSRIADGFLCDSLFVSNSAVLTNLGSLVNLLRDPGRLALLSVTGDALVAWPPELELGPGLSRSALSSGLTYRLATTVEYLRRHPELAASGFELSARPLWTMGREILESGQVK